MKTINQNLINLYKTALKKLKPQIQNYDFDGPLLMHVWEEDYLKSKYKILFIGRETNGWLGDLHTEVEGPIEKYKDFALANNGRYTTFWQYIYEFKNILMPDTIGQKNFSWTNVSKFSTFEGNALEIKDFEFFSKHFKVLEQEIEITHPNVIIFFTDDNWDKKLQSQISSKISYEKVDLNTPISELARLKAKNFPHHTYRVPHPITMQTKKKWCYMEAIMKNIKITKE